MQQTRWWLATAVVLATACERRPPGCVPGAMAVCPCAGAPVGTQRCQDNGSFGACACPSAPALPFAPPPTAPPMIVPPAPPAQVVRAPVPPAPVTSEALPMDQARQCMRDNASNMAASNACVVSVLRGRASTEPELALLATTYRVMGRTGDALRTMRTYIQRYPTGARVPNYQQYIEANAR